MTDTRDALDRMLHDAVLAPGDSGEWRRVGHAEADRATGRLPADER